MNNNSSISSSNNDSSKYTSFYKNYLIKTGESIGTSGRVSYNSLKTVGVNVKSFSKEHPYVVGCLIAPPTILIGVPLIINFIGFTGSGIAAGSYASTMMSKFVIGSKIIGTFQAIGAKGSILIGGYTSLFPVVGIPSVAYAYGKISTKLFNSPQTPTTTITDTKN